MSENGLFMGLYGLAALGLVVLGFAGELILKRYRAARAKRILNAAAERSREDDLLDRYKRTRMDVHKAAGMQ